MSHFERRQDSLITPDQSNNSETSFSTIVEYASVPLPKTPNPSFLPLDHPQIICLNSVSQSRYNIGKDHVIICNDPILAQNLACDIAKSQLYDDPHTMHKRLIKMHNAHLNLKVDLGKIINDLEKLPTFHTPKQNKLRAWIRKSQVMFLGTFAGLLLTVITAIMIYIVIKLKLVLKIFG